MSLVSLSSEKREEREGSGVRREKRRKGAKQERKEREKGLRDRKKEAGRDGKMAGAKKETTVVR